MLMASLTLVHAIEDLVELLLGVFTVVLPPALPRLAPQDDQLPLRPPQGREVGDLHDHRPAWRAGGRGQRLALMGHVISMVMWTKTCYVTMKGGLDKIL